MQQENEKKWHALYCMPRWEKKVALGLEKQEISHYCPLNKVQRQWSDRKKIVEEPLFKSYVFVQLTDKEKIDALRTPGVINFVHWLGKPAVIRDEEIEVIKRFLNDYESVSLERIDVSVDDEVVITTGPFLDRQGRVLEITNKLVKVMLPSLGYAMVAQVARESVKVVPITEAKKDKQRKETDVS